MAENARLLPLSDADWPESIDTLRLGFAGGLNVYRVMAHHPALLAAWADLRDHVVNRTALGRVRSEVVILRTGFRLGSGYEWRQHVIRARRLGMEDSRILSLQGARQAMSDEDATLASAVDELIDNACLQPDTLSALTKLAGKEGVLDLMATVGFYSVLGYLLKTFETPLDEDIAKELAEIPIGEVT